MAFKNLSPIYGSNRAFDLDTTIGASTVGDPILLPDNITNVVWTIVIPTGIKAKLQATSFSQEKITNPATNLDEYWIDWDMEGDPAQDVNGYVLGPITIQGAIPVTTAIRLRRETGSATDVLLGLRGQ